MATLQKGVLKWTCVITQVICSTRPSRLPLAAPSTFSYIGAAQADIVRAASCSKQLKVAVQIPQTPSRAMFHSLVQRKLQNKVSSDAAVFLPDASLIDTTRQSSVPLGIWRTLSDQAMVFTFSALVPASLAVPESVVLALCC